MNIEQLAKEAGFYISATGLDEYGWVADMEELQSFAFMVIEECAKVCDVTWEGPHKTAADRLAASIRALKEQP